MSSRQNVQASRNEHLVVNESKPIDPLKALWTPNVAHANVTMSVSKGLEFGALKVHASVTLEVDQEDAKMEIAGGEAFRRAVELCNEGFRLLTEGA